jgi:hypothetical protein
MDDLRILWLILVAVGYAVFLTLVITKGVVLQNERELACISVGYEGYDAAYKACRARSNPIVLYPYEEALARKVE